MLGILLDVDNIIEVTSFGNLTKRVALNDEQNSVLYPCWIIEKGYQRNEVQNYNFAQELRLKNKIIKVYVNCTIEFKRNSDN